MAKMLKQRIKGFRGKTLVIDALEADLTALKGLMAGAIESFDLKSSGGTAVASPSSFNRKAFTVGKTSVTGRLSAWVDVPHIKSTRMFSDISTDVVGQFDASYTSAEKCEYANLKFDS